MILRWGRRWLKQCPKVPPGPVHRTISFSKVFNFPLQYSETGVEMFARWVPHPSPHHAGCEKGSPWESMAPLFPPLPILLQPCPRGLWLVALEHGTAHGQCQGRKCYMRTRTSFGDEFQRIPTASCQFPSADCGHGSCAHRRAPAAIQSSSFLPPHQHTHI